MVEEFSRILEIVHKFDIAFAFVGVFLFFFLLQERLVVVVGGLIYLNSVLVLYKLSYNVIYNI